MLGWRLNGIGTLNSLRCFNSSLAWNEVPLPSASPHRSPFRQSSSTALSATAFRPSFDSVRLRPRTARLRQGYGRSRHLSSGLVLNLVLGHDSCRAGHWCLVAPGEEPLSQEVLRQWAFPELC